MTTQEGLPALATDEEIAMLREWGPETRIGRVIARLEAAERQVKAMRAKLAARYRGIMPKYPPDYPGGFDGPTGAE